MNIHIPGICGEDLISRDSGKKVRDLILANWNAPEIVIDLENKLVSSVSFFDEAFALLIKKGEKTPEEILKKIRFEKIRPEDRDLLNYVFSTRVKEWKGKRRKDE